MDTYAGKVHVRWAPNEAVTPLGQLPFFIDYLKQAGLFDALVADCPLYFTSPNAPKKRDVLGTLLMSVATGANRYAHINALRHDGVNPALLGMTRVCSDDSVRRALLSMDEEEAADWLRGHLDFVVRPLMQESWVLDIDSTVKPIYGRQEGAEIGYNPTKPGRPSHSYHTYAMAETRLVLDVEVMPGNQHRSTHGMPGLLRLLDGMRPDERPVLVRGDADYGTEPLMAALEARDQDYLFKLRMTSRVKDLVQKVASRRGWQYAGQGWEGATAELQLSGWTKKRNVLVLRRRLKRHSALAYHGTDQAGQQTLGFAELVEAGQNLYEYTVLVTSYDAEPLTLAQLYRDRSDAENIFDELKNHWGWGGFTTKDLKRTRITARMTALVYDWWSLFVRLIDPMTPREAITSRPRLMTGVARATRHSGQTSLLITSSHGEAVGIQEAFATVTRFLRGLTRNAPQLSPPERWCRILARALMPYLHGRVPKPPPALLSA